MRCPSHGQLPCAGGSVILIRQLIFLLLLTCATRGTYVFRMFSDGLNEFASALSVIVAVVFPALVAVLFVGRLVPPILNLLGLPERAKYAAERFNRATEYLRY